MKILQYPDPLLSEKSEFIVSQKEGESLADKLTEAFAVLPGNKAGLAAPQIGENKNMAIVLGVPCMNLEFTPARVFQHELDHINGKLCSESALQKTQS